VREHLLIFWQRKLEDAYRQNYDLNSDNALLKAEVERLTKAGDNLVYVVTEHPVAEPFVKAWAAAKEGKPRD
jgi:hypothetical protein